MSHTYLTPRQYAEQRSLHPQTVYRHLRRGNIAGAERIGGSWRIRVDEDPGLGRIEQALAALLRSEERL